MIDFYNPNIPTAATEYCVLLPFVALLAALFNIAFKTIGLDVPPYYTSDLVPYMYEMLPIAFNGVRK